MHKTRDENARLVFAFKRDIFGIIYLNFLWVLMEGWMAKKYEYEKGLVSIRDGLGGVASFMMKVFNFLAVLVFERQYLGYS